MLAAQSIYLTLVMDDRFPVLRRVQVHLKMLKPRIANARPMALKLSATSAASI